MITAKEARKIANNTVLSTLDDSILAVARCRNLGMTTTRQLTREEIKSLEDREFKVTDYSTYEGPEYLITWAE